jgi:hypothetical protein
MAKTWHLDTETKGTGAHVAPLEKASERRAQERELATVTLERPPRSVQAPAPPGPRTFKVVDIRSAEVLGEAIDTRATVELLESVGSVLDIRIYVWVERTGRWRLLNLEEQRTLWAFRRPAA